MLPKRERVTFAVGNRVQGLNYNMVNVLVWSNYEIAMERFLNYKRLLKEAEEYLSSLLKLYDLAEDFEIPPGSQKPEYQSLAATKNRVRTLKSVQRDALRRVVSIYLLINRDVRELASGEHRLEYEDMARRIASYEKKERTTQKDPPVKAFNWKERLDTIRDVIQDITDNFVGNEGLKNSIYEDVVSFLADGASSMSVYRNYVFM